MTKPTRKLLVAVPLALAACAGSPTDAIDTDPSQLDVDEVDNGPPSWEFVDVWNEWGVEDNRAPVVRQDVVQGDEDSVIAVSVEQLLSNDYDPERRPLEVVGVGDAADGAVELADGEVVFTPRADFYGKASFEYTVSDGMVATAGRVEVQVKNVNDAPRAVDDEFQTAEDVPLVLRVADLLSNDVDVDQVSPRLWVTALGVPDKGTVGVSNGQITFTPKADFHGPATFTYEVSDGDAVATGMVRIKVTEVAECGDGEVNDKFNAVAMSFSWLAAGCDGPNQISFTIDGVEVLGTQAGEANCLSPQRVQQAVVLDPTLLARVQDKVSFGVSVPGRTLLGWARVDIASAHGEMRRVVLHDADGGDDAMVGNIDLVGAGATEDTQASVDDHFGEQCDDGNAVDYDGCSSVCLVE